MSEKKFIRKNNILQIVPSLNCGGVERGTLDIAKAIIASGNQAFVLSCGGILTPKLEEIGAELVKHDVASKNPITIYNNISFIEKLIEDRQINLVHARSRASAWSAYFASKRSGTPFVTTFHGIYSLKSSLKKYYNKVMTLGDRVIAVSEFVKRHIIENYQIDESIIRTIHRGVDLNYFSPANITTETQEKFADKYNIDFSRPLIIMPSRLTSWKGQHVLVDALAQIKNLNFYCILTGDLSKHPEYVNRVRDRIIEQKLQSRVQIFGPETDIVGLYNMANIVISASIEPEAFGRTVVEGQAMQKLVIATNIGGCAETITNGETGFLTNPNDPTHLAEMIKHCLGIVETSKEKKIVQAAREGVSKNFSLDKMQKKTLAVYSELINL
ncbi:MAG: glycosyltransferase [Rickettsiaceae bacterium]|nr:glycosyltransferase [Rickettsiaceae bacterium]